MNLAALRRRHAPMTALVDPKDVNQSEPLLDYRSVLEIHRGNPDGFVGFMAKKQDGKGLFSVGAVRVQDVRESIPGVLAHWIGEDGYFTVNSYWRAGGVWKKTGLPWLLRRENNLMELAAAYADLDVGRPQEESKHPGASLDWQAGQIRVLQLQRARLIPPFSILACSGRGVYLLWLLKDERDPSRLPRAFDSTIVRYKAVNRGLHERLEGLACDPIFDAARVIRVPGSIHSRVMRRVTFSLTMQGNDGGRLAYSLRELEDLLGIEAPVPSLPDPVRNKALPRQYVRGQYKKTMAKGSVPNRKAGFQRVNQLRAADLETIEAWRGGWLHGGRAYPDGFVSPGRGLMLRLYADWLRGSGQDVAGVQRAVKTMAANCRPPYPSDPNDSTLAAIVSDIFSANPRKHFKNVKTARLLLWLGIDERTAPELLQRLDTIIPKSVRDLRLLELDTQAEIVARRRAAIMMVVERAGSVPSLRKLSALLAGIQEMNPITRQPWSHVSLWQDCRALGLQMRKRGRPKVKDATNQQSMTLRMSLNNDADWLSDGYGILLSADCIIERRAAERE